MRRRVVLLLCLVGVLAIAAAAVALPLPPINHDLAVDVQVFPPVVTAGGAAQVTVTVWNLGTLDDMAKLTVTTRIAGKTITKVQRIWLPIRGSAAVTQTVQVPNRAPAGDYPIVATVDLTPDPRADSNLLNNIDQAFIVVGQ